MENGRKEDKGKPIAGVLGDFSLALSAVVDVGTFGAQKYSRGNWQYVDQGRTRYTDAMWRHLLAANSEELDAETGCSHEAAMVWNALARLELKLRNERGITAMTPDWAGVDMAEGPDVTVEVSHDRVDALRALDTPECEDVTGGSIQDRIKQSVREFYTMNVGYASRCTLGEEEYRKLCDFFGEKVVTRFADMHVVPSVKVSGIHIS